MDEQVKAFIDKGREYVDAATQKGCELVERTRLSIKISEAKAELRKDYIRLGKLAYQDIEEDCDKYSDEMKTLAACVAVDKERLEFLTLEFSEISGMKICDKCGKKNAENAKYCNNCGTEI